jgi:GH15 family glucan-1,4-alpha-glucosidase
MLLRAVRAAPAAALIVTDGVLTMERAPFKPLADYAVIGDQRTCALVGTDGSIDSFCFPRFDSPSVFAALLDPERGGYWQIAPRLPDASRRQLYIPDTNVLLTRSLSTGGVGELVDFMPVEDRGGARALVRRARAVRGELEFDCVLAPRFAYATANHRVIRTADGSIVFESEDGIALRLRVDVPCELVDGDVRARFRLRTGETASFVLEPAELGDASPWQTSKALDEAFDRTVRYWHRWARRSSYRGRWVEPVHRSALVLKLMQDADHGTFVAAPTFGLPEWPGGTRNWDYRYVWIRDTAFALHALHRLGIVDEADRFIEWVSRLDPPRSGEAPLRVLYRVDGRSDTQEQVLEQLSGYLDSRPVRVGNAAADQLQLDIFGELLDTIAIYDRDREPVHLDTWRLVTEIADWVAGNWQLEDDGIWEMRSGRREFLHSRVMCWVALDRAMHLAARNSLPGANDRWHRERDAIFDDVQRRFWSSELGAFVQTPSRSTVDASSLVMPLVRFISPTDPRWRSHLREVERVLVEDATVYRYPPHRRDDGLPGPEGSFSVCSFWFVECLALAGEIERAQLLFDKMLSYANHVGLYSEQLGPAVEHLGNMPQLLTHLGLINAATTLDRVLDEVGE